MTLSNTCLWIIVFIIVSLLFIIMNSKSGFKGGHGEGQILTQSISRMTPQQAMASTAPLPSNVLGHIESFSQPTPPPPPNLTDFVWYGPYDRNYFTFNDHTNEMNVFRTRNDAANNKYRTHVVAVTFSADKTTATDVRRGNTYTRIGRIVSIRDRNGRFLSHLGLITRD